MYINNIFFYLFCQVLFTQCQMAHNVQGIRGFGHRISGHKSDLSILTPAFVSAGAQNLGGVSRENEGIARLT